MTIPYQCQLLYKGQPVTVVLAELAVPKCNQCGELVFDYEADDQINRAFEAQTSALSNRDGTNGPTHQSNDTTPAKLPSPPRN